jgi:hypothetical protein
MANLLRGGYQWVGRAHGIELDEHDFVWIGGDADNASAPLKFSLDGNILVRLAKSVRTSSND